MLNKKEKIIVVGAGIGGLVSALTLSDLGLDVTVIDKNKDVGGKLRSIASDEGPIDAGPTVLTLIDIFVNIFSEANSNLFDEVDLYQEHTLARHWWPDGTSLDLYSDHEKNLSNITSLFGEKTANAFNSFHNDCKNLFFSFDKSLIKNPNPAGFFTKPSFFKNMHQVARVLGKPQTFWKKLTKYFDEPKLRQLFGRYATYVGASPFNSPSILQLIWFAEFSGVWRIKGGLHKLAQRIKSISEERGVKYILGESVDEILVNEKAVEGIKLANEEKIISDFIIFNGDPRGLSNGIMGDETRDLLRESSVEPRSLSAYVWSFSAEAKGCPLIHHNVFFNNNYLDEFTNLETGLISQDPTLYVCAQEPGIKNRRKKRFEIIVNAPPCSSNKISIQKEYDLCQEITFRKLEKMGLTFNPMPSSDNLSTPTNFENLCPGTDGSLYGLSQQKMLSTFLRPTTKTKIKGLYLAGGGIHPGPGLPMAALSGKHAAEMIKKDLALI